MPRKIIHHRNIGHDTTACGMRSLAKWRCVWKKDAVTCSRCRRVLGLIPGERKAPKRVEGYAADDKFSGDFIDRRRYTIELQGVRDALVEWDRVSTSCVSPGETLATGNKLAMAVLLLVPKL